MNKPKRKEGVYYVIYDEESGKYWDRITRSFRSIVFATKYDGNNIDDVEDIALKHPDIPEGYYTLKRMVVRKNNE
jgi:hypothetical protein